jgi:hypothetical protein
MVAPTKLFRNITYYALDSDFSEYVMEHSIKYQNELWVLLEDYLKEECE